MSRQTVAHIALVVEEYDEAIEFFVEKLDFELIVDEYLPAQDKRWVIVAPPDSKGANLVLSRAVDERQRLAIGNQAGGRVFLFLATDNFDFDYQKMTSRGVRFRRPPRTEPYGKVAVFEDLYGNLWDLIEPVKKGGN